MELRKQPPESLCQLQESLFVHPPAETPPLAKESTAVDICDFEEDTKPLSKTVVDLQLVSAKVSQLSNIVVDYKKRIHQTGMSQIKKNPIIGRVLSNDAIGDLNIAS
jgi:hypothetical protein